MIRIFWEALKCLPWIIQLVKDAKAFIEEHEREEQIRLKIKDVVDELIEIQKTTGSKSIRQITDEDRARLRANHAR